MLSLLDFDYHLPEHLIAQLPNAHRNLSKLLILNEKNEIKDAVFSNIIELLSPKDVLVFNNTKVIHARLFATKPTGGRVEIFVERILDDRYILAMLRASHMPKPGTYLNITPEFQAEVISRKNMMFKLALHAIGQKTNISTLDIIETCGKLPLPPYIKHIPESIDEQRYQTVYAKNLGAVAAPTAGLHFTTELLQTLTEKNIRLAELTLHVGAGTFLPVKTEDISKHTMHSEWYCIDEATQNQLEETRKQGGKIVAVGTTSLRALESWAWQKQAACGDTEIFITPGYPFKVVDALITNFHLPKSTLLMLVSAFSGLKNIRRAYQHAIEKEYRFFSYGDAMWLTKIS